MTSSDIGSFKGYTSFFVKLLAVSFIIIKVENNLQT